MFEIMAPTDWHLIWQCSFYSYKSSGRILEALFCHTISFMSELRQLKLKLCNVLNQELWLLLQLCNDWDWNCALGRLRYAWLQVVECDLALLNIGLATANHQVQNRRACTPWGTKKEPIFFCGHLFNAWQKLVNCYAYIKESISYHSAYFNFRMS